MSAVRPVPRFRGDQVASGVVALGVLVVLLQLRLGWAAGVQLAVAAVAVVFVGWVVAGLEREPRPYVSAILLTLLGLSLVVLIRLAQVLGADGAGAGTVAWIALALGLEARWLARRHDTATATLVAAVAVVVVVVGWLMYVADPTPGVVRAVLLVAATCLALAAVSRRDRRPPHAAQLANAAGLALVAIAVTPVTFTLLRILAPALLPTAAFYGGVGSVGWGWEVPLLAGGFGLVAYGAVDRQRGPVLVGVLVLGAFVASAGGGDGSLLGWPIVLGLGAAALLVTGLRPTTSLGPGPEDAGDAEPPPVLRLR